MTSKPEATTTPKTHCIILQIANAILTFCFILFTLTYAFSISITQAASYSGVVAWLVQTHFTHSWNKTKLILIWPIGLFFLSCVLSVITAVDPALSLSGLKKLLKAIVFFWAINALTLIRPVDLLACLSRRFQSSKIGNLVKTLTRSLITVNPLNFLVGLFIFTGTLSAVYGIFQGLTHPQGIWSRVGVHGSLSNIMTYSVIIMLVASLVLARILFDSRAPKKLLIGALALLGVVMILTLIRQAWLGLFIAALFLLFIRKKVLVLVPFLLIGLILVFGPDTFSERLKSIVDPQQASNNQRIMLLKAGWDVFEDYPLTGCGFKCLFVVADQYPEHSIFQDRHGKRQLQYRHLHNNVLQIAVDTGAIGLCAWLSIWVVYFIQLIRRSRQMPLDTDGRWVVFGSAAAVIAFLVAGMFENSFYDSEIIIVVYFIMALPFVDSNSAKSASSNPRSPSTSR